jgi:hypothetical protein
MCDLETSLCIQSLVKRKILTKNNESSVFLISCVGLQVLIAVAMKNSIRITILSSPLKEK